jgi:hypothetical protein
MEFAQVSALVPLLNVARILEDTLTRERCGTNLPPFQGAR